MYKPNIRNRACAGTAIAAFVLTGLGSTAEAAAANEGQAAQGSTIAEVVVTARKKTESLQKVPVAVSSFSGTTLAEQGIRETNDLQKAVPSLTVSFTPINANTSQATAAVFSLRGQSAGDVLLTVSEPVGVYEDSANVPHPDGLNAAFFDVQRVEVLKGPQGTLYGRNTTGGAVNILTRGADDNGYHGFISGEVGNHDDWKIGGAVNLPVVPDKLAVRIAYQHWNRQGYGNDPITGQHPGEDHDDDTVRLSVRFEPFSNLTSSTKFEFDNLNQVGYLQTLVGLSGASAALEAGLETGCGSFANIGALVGCGTAALNKWINAGPFTVGSQEHLSDKVQTYHAVEDLTWQITDDIKLRSITGFHRVSDYPVTDLDGTPYQILEIFAGAQGPQPIVDGPYTHTQIPEEVYNSYTQEFNLSGHALGRVDWLVGAFASWEDGYGGEPYIPFGALEGNGFTSTTTVSDGEDTKTYAVFTQDTVHIIDNLSLDLGVRYTHESITNNSQQFYWAAGQYYCEFSDAAGDPGPAAPGNDPSKCYTIRQTTSSGGVSYLASLNYQVTPDTLVYVKTSRGFRGGALQFRAAGFPPVQPETATDYEIGLKSDFFDHRLRTNLAGYHTDYINKQEDVITTVCGLDIVPAAQPTCATGGPPHSTTVLANAANAKVNGFEAEVTAAPAAGWTVYGTLTYLDGKYSQFLNAYGPDGNKVPNASGLPFQDPNWRYSVGSRYEHDLGPGRLGGSIDWTWRAHNNLTALNISPSFSLPLQESLNAAVGLLDGRIDYKIPRHGLTVAVFATNLLDKHYQTEALFSAALGIATASTQAPRMFGLTVTKTFGE